MSFSYSGLDLSSNLSFRFIYKPVDPERKDVADPERVPDAEDQWMCPFCKKKDFFELSQVWSHFDATDECKITHLTLLDSKYDILDTKCPGEIMGVELRLENGLIGVIRNKDISSSETIEDPTTRMAIDQVVTGRITQIDHERFKGMVFHRQNDSEESFTILSTN